MIRNLKFSGDRIFAEYNYLLRYDIRSGKFNCTCKAFVFGRDCHHIEEFKKKIRRLKR